MFSAQHKFGRLGAPAGRSLEAQIAALFSDGIIYDPSDLTTLFQDSAGTTPVTALEQPVGLMLDKSRGLVLGGELFSGGDGTDVSGWTGPTGDGSFVSSGGQFVLTAANPISTFTDRIAYKQFSGLTSGKTYVVTATLRNISAISFGCVLDISATGVGFAAATVSTTSTSSTPVRLQFTPASSSAFVRLTVSAGAGSQVACDNISVRELPGYHATNIPGDTTTRPVTKAGVLLNFDGANDGMVSSTGGGATSGFAFITAIKLQGGSKTQTVFSDAGTNAGFRVRINSSNQLELSAGNGSTFVSAATTDTLSVGTTAVIAAWHDGVNLNVQVNNGTVAQQSLASATAGTAGFTLGRDNGASSSFMQAQTSAMLYAKKVLTASQIAVAKRYCAQKAGVAL